MTKKIITIDNESALDTIKLYAKALFPKKAKDKNSIPNKIIRKNKFSFSRSEIQYFTHWIGFKKESTLIPPIYINLLAFRLQMHLVLDDDFPYPAMGMVHVSNKIIQHKPFLLADIEKAEAYFDLPKKHKRGIVFTIITKAYDKKGVILVENHAEQLKIIDKIQQSTEAKKEFTALEGESVEWNLAENTGRHFAKISGDINPIHLFKLAAKLFGFRRHIAHGMYSVSRGLAILEKKNSNIQSFEYYTEFKQPVFLPSKVVFITHENSSQSFDLQLVSKDKCKPHMMGYFRVNI